MSGWKSRWSLLRLVKTAAAQWIPSARCSCSAWLETSIAQARSPARSIPANARWRSMASGVVRASGAGGGGGGRPPPPADDALDRAQQRGRHPGRLEQRADQESRGGLAVGAGDADDAQLRRGVAVIARGDRRHRRADVVDEHLG